MLLQMGNATYFCVLTLYPITLVNTLISSNNYFVESLGFSTRKIIPSANRDNFTSSFPTCMPFISFSYPVALAKISSTVLNRSGESGHPCLVPNLRGKAFSLSPLCMMFAVSYMKHSFSYTADT